MMSTFKKILCPTDFSEISYEGLNKAVELAQRDTTEICLLYVETPLRELNTSSASKSAESAHLAEAVYNLRDVLADRLPENVRSQPLLRSGDAAEEIVKAAREEGCDLIVLTTHGAQGWREGVLGSVAEHVLRHAPCAVLTLSGSSTGHTYIGSTLLQETSGSMKPEMAIDNNHKLYLDGD